MTPEEPVVALRTAVASDAETFASWAADEHFCRAAEWPADRSVHERVVAMVSLIADPPAPALVVKGRLGGSAITVAAVNALASRAE